MKKAEEESLRFGSAHLTSSETPPDHRLDTPVLLRGLHLIVALRSQTARTAVFF
jgi:hypothetical protein